MVERWAGGIMAGIANDYLIYPIMDLVSNLKTEKDVSPFEGEPSVIIYRDDPLDPDKVTGVRLVFKSQYKIDITLKYGTFDSSRIPLTANPESPDYDFYLTERLDEVFVSYLEPSGQVIEIYNITLNYDENGLLQGTTVNYVDV